MAKASPAVRAFNAGEFSELMYGRTDLDRYPASMRRLLNYIAAPQGPAIARSGTAYVAAAADHAAFSALVPFVFSNEQAKILEFGSDRIRFLDEDGLQVYDPVAATLTNASGAAIQFTSADLGASVGDQVVLSDFPSNYNLNGETATITVKVGTAYTLDKVFPNLAVVNGTVARVYHVPCVYSQAEREALRYVQSVDVVYLLTNTKRPRKLSRYGTYDWRLEDIQFKDGPYMPVNETTTTLTPSATGNAIPNMTSNTTPSGVCSGNGSRPAVTGTYESPVEWPYGRKVTFSLPATDFFHAFNDNDEQYWAGPKGQSSRIEYQPATPFVCDGYTIYAAMANEDPDYLAKDFAPGTWTFEGWDGSAWVVLDRRENYVLYDANKSAFFEIDNDTAYSKYQLNIKKCTRNGLIEPRVRRLVMRSAATPGIALTASATTGINNDAGFKATDVGRLVRLKGKDNSWRSCEITAYTSPTVVTVALKGEPLLDTSEIREWRLGYWSDTTGWPTVGDFFEDRFWLAGPDEFPDQFAGSVVGDYETFSQTDTFGAVLDDSAVVGRLNSRKLSRILWLSSDDRGLLLGTGSEEYSLKATGANEPLTARTAKARPTTRRGSSSVEPVRVDDQVLFVQRSGRTVREFAFVFEADGYRSPSMSQLASHLGTVPFAEMDYAAEPHSIVWLRRQDNSLVGLTYNREENVIGWHQHDISGAEVEALAVLPQKDQLQDALWLVCKRVVNGQTKRYIERLTRFWDFDTALEDAWYVDCGLRYSGEPVGVVYGLQHLEGEEVYGLADNRPVGPFTVTNGSVTLAFDASNIVLGLGFDSEAETSSLENGAADGTAQGKVKRTHSVVVHVWRSAGGEVGVWNDEVGAVYEPLEYPGRFDEIEDVALYSGKIGPFTPSPGYSERGTLLFRRPKNSPLPFNIVALLPQLHTQDR